LLALGIGPAIGFAAWGALRFIEFGSRDEWGAYPAATAVGTAVGCAFLAFALVGIFRWLRHEEPVQLGNPLTAPLAGA
jgi:hypothetical protein